MLFLVLKNMERLIEEYINYNVDNDPTGAKGHALANAVLRKFGNLKNLQERLNQIRNQYTTKNQFQTS